MITAGFWMLALVAILLVATGLPAFMVLIGVAAGFAALGLATGTIAYPLLTALPLRVTGLLETDLLQALPLYVLMGALLNRLPLADILFRAGTAAFRRSAAAPLLAAIGLGALLAPMNGSVGASVATLSRVVQPRLIARGISLPQSLAIVCVASTLGVVVPPSLVLILLGDTMLRAHTEAINATGALTRVINTQDVFQGALMPAAMFLLLAVLLAWWRGRGAGARRDGRADPVRPRDWAIAALTFAFILGLFAAVIAGYIYAVEGAACGAFAVFVFGLLTGSLRRETLTVVLRDTMAVTGALFALFIAATSFTLVFRAFGTDQLIAELIGSIPGGTIGAALAGLLLLGLSAFVLDAFEIILVIIPLIMPPLLIRVPDAVWMASLALLTLQASFLVPPFGYAVMMARTLLAEAISFRAILGTLAPFMTAQLLVLALVVAFPGLTHVVHRPAAAPPHRSDAEVKKLFDNFVPIVPEDQQ
jgi:TRAP-type mannitol/chloroaromatic compound transport system permease large subunit